MTRYVATALAALALVGATESHARTAVRTGRYWIVLGSNRDGADRAYSVRPDGSRLTPLLGRAFFPVSISGDGRTVAYRGDRGPYHSDLYVSHADGTGLHRVVRNGFRAALSPNGKRLAFPLSGKREGLAVVGTDGRGLRRLTSGDDDAPSWSPDGKALVFHRYISRTGDDEIVVQPLRGKARVLGRGRSPQWSPDGRWIAYQSTRGLDLNAIQPDGRRRHRVLRGDESGFAWSSDGRRLAIATSAGELVVTAADGRVLRRMRLREPAAGAVAWSPDGHRVAFASGPYGTSAISAVGADGRGLRRVATLGTNSLVGWTGVAPKRAPAPPVPPSARVVSAGAVATRAPIYGLSADGGRVAFAVGGTTVDCDHVVVWTPGKKTLVRFRRRGLCGEGNNSGFVYDVQLAGSRVGWSEIGGCGNYCDATLVTATLTRHTPQPLADGAESSSGDYFDFHLRGAGGLLVYDDRSRLVRIGVGSERCSGDYDARICSTLRRGSHAVAADSVSGGLVAVREPSAVAVLDAKGALVRVFPSAAGEITAARLDGGRLFVSSEDLLAAYDVSTGAALFQRSLPRGFAVRDVDGGIAVLQSGSRLTLLRLADRRSFTLTLRGRVLADLEPDGLYYSYGTAGGGGRVVLMPRSEVARKLGGSARAFAAARSSWIVLGSDRDGQVRPYSVRPDGSRLTLLLPPTPASLAPVGVSRNGAVVVYEATATGEIDASRASGAGLRKLGARGLPEALSRDGRLLAYQDDGIWIVGTDGRGRRRLSSSSWESASDWSPAGDALLVATEARRGDRPQKPALWIQPLRGRRRLLARGAGGGAWSPDGRWIAYHLGDDLWAVRPDGRRRHRVARHASAFEWSPEGRRLAFATGKDIVIVGVGGRRLRTIRVRGVSFVVSARWSPDGRRLAFESDADDGRQVGVVGVDGRGLRRVTSLGDNTLTGWTPLAPVGPPAAPLLPSERVLEDDSVAARRPILGLSADGSRAAFIAAPTAADCSHVVVWTPAARALDRFRPSAPCERHSGEGEYGVELAGSRAAWVHQSGCGTTCTATIETATPANRSPQPLTIDTVESSAQFDYHLRGDGDLLVFDDESRLVRIGVGAEPCQQRVDPVASICTTLRRGPHAAAVDSVSGSLIAVREQDAVAVLDEQGALLRVFPFGPGDVTAARLDGGRLVVARSGVLEVYDVASGAGESQRPLPTGFSLVDVDGGIAVLERGTTIMLLRLDDGRTWTMSPGTDPVLADLESSGLYYSYTAADGGGRVALMQRAEVEQKLGG